MKRHQKLLKKNSRRAHSNQPSILSAYTAQEKDANFDFDGFMQKTGNVPEKKKKRRSFFADTRG